MSSNLLPEHQLTCDSCTVSHQKFLLLVSGGVTGHSIEVHQIPQHPVSQHGQVGGDGCQGVAHEDARGVAGKVELAEQEFNRWLAEMGSTFQELDQRGEGRLQSK